jgi:hypothetical protein
MAARKVRIGAASRDQPLHDLIGAQTARGKQNISCSPVLLFALAGEGRHDVGANRME